MLCENNYAIILKHHKVFHHRWLRNRSQNLDNKICVILCLLGVDGTSAGGCKDPRYGGRCRVGCGGQLGQCGADDRSYRDWWPNTRCSVDMSLLYLPQQRIHDAVRHVQVTQVLLSPCHFVVVTCGDGGNFAVAPSVYSL